MLFHCRKKPKSPKKKKKEKKRKIVLEDLQPFCKLENLLKLSHFPQKISV